MFLTKPTVPSYLTKYLGKANIQLKNEFELKKNEFELKFYLLTFHLKKFSAATYRTKIIPVKKKILNFEKKKKKNNYKKSGWKECEFFEK